MALLATFHGGTTATSVNNLLSESGLAHPFAVVFGPGGNNNTIVNLRGAPEVFIESSTKAPTDHAGGLAIVGIGSGG